MKNLLTKTLLISLLLSAATPSGVQANQSRGDFLKAIVTRAVKEAKTGALVGALVQAINATDCGNTARTLAIGLLVGGPLGGAIGGLGGAAIEIVKGIYSEYRWQEKKQQQQNQ